MKIAIIGASGHLGKAVMSTLIKEYPNRQIEFHILRATSNKSEEFEVFCRFYQSESILVTSLHDLTIRTAKIDSFDSILFLGSYIPGKTNSNNSFDKELAAKPVFTIIDLLKSEIIKSRNLIFVSSAAVYGSLGSFDIDSPLAPTDEYGRYKIEMEAAFIDYANNYSVPLDILRPTLIYGPGETIPRLTTLLINKLLTGKELMISGSKGLRNYIYILDVVRYIIDLIFDDYKHTVRVHNLGSAPFFTIETLVELAWKTANSFNKNQAFELLHPNLSEEFSTNFTVEPYFQRISEFHTSSLEESIWRYVFWAINGKPLDFY